MAEQREAAKARRADRAAYLRAVAAVYAQPVVGDVEVPPDPDPAPAAKRPVRRNTDIPTATRRLVWARAGRRCERCRADVAGGRGQVHHRRPRGSGGSRALDIHSPANLLLLCWDCHGWVESYRTRARRVGLLVRQGRNPRVIPVALAVGRVLLHPTEPRYVPVPSRKRRKTPDNVAPQPARA